MSKLLSTRRLAPLAVVGAALAISACDGLLTENPPHIIVADNLYLDAAGFEAGLAALYSLAREERESWTGSSSIRQSFWIAGTDQAYIPSFGTGFRAFQNFGVEAAPVQALWLGHWSWLYETVNAANTIISRAENPGVRWTPAQKNHILAEARFFRAWAYRHLAYGFGDVPLNLEESSGASVRADWERTPVAEVWRQVEQDLLFAEEHLPATHNDPGRLVRAVAQHYLADVYLAKGEYSNAEQKAQAVIDSGLYSLVTERYGVRANQPGVPFMDQFYEGNVNRNQGNTEVLWAFQTNRDATGGGSVIMRRTWLPAYERLAGMEITVETGGRGVTRLSPTRWALNLYEPQDDRASYHAIRWFLVMNDPTGLPAGAQLGDTIWLNHNRTERATIVPDWPWSRKNEWADPLNPIGGDEYKPQAVKRLAETYLLLAEAQFNQGKLTEAAENLNIVRRRSNASEITPAHVTIDFVLDERSRELLTEEERRYALLRTGQFLERTRLHNPLAGANIQDHHVLFPVPQAVIDANLDRTMPQNPGY
jgi:starch-binding outer membrane protein, SusD/RagB family